MKWSPPPSPTPPRESTWSSSSGSGRVFRLMLVQMRGSIRPRCVCVRAFCVIILYQKNSPQISKFSLCHYHSPPSHTHTHTYTHTHTHTHIRSPIVALVPDTPWVSTPPFRRASTTAWTSAVCSRPLSSPSPHPVSVVAVCVYMHARGVCVSTCMHVVCVCVFKFMVHFLPLETGLGKREHKNSPTSSPLVATPTSSGAAASSHSSTDTARRHIVSELLQTEKNFVNILNIIVNVRTHSVISRGHTVCSHYTLTLH